MEVFEELLFEIFYWKLSNELSMSFQIRAFRLELSIEFFEKLKKIPVKILIILKKLQENFQINFLKKSLAQFPYVQF